MAHSHINVTIQGDSREAVAYALLLKVTDAERVRKGESSWSPDEDWILRTYARCLKATL